MCWHFGRCTHIIGSRCWVIALAHVLLEHFRSYHMGQIVQIDVVLVMLVGHLERGVQVGWVRHICASIIHLNGPIVASPRLEGISLSYSASRIILRAALRKLIRDRHRRIEHLHLLNLVSFLARRLSHPTTRSHTLRWLLALVRKSIVMHDGCSGL